MSTARHHAEWLSLVEVSGPFLSMPVLMRVFPQGLDAHDPDHFRDLRAAFERWETSQSGPRRNPAAHDEWARFVLGSTLGLPDEVIVEGQAIPQTLYANMAEHGELLRPDLVVRNPKGGPDEGKGRLLVQVHDRDQDLEKPLKLRSWKASPATRMTELLRSTGVRLGLVTNGERWMLVYAPRGETAGFASWFATLWLEEKITLRAFQSLLGVRRFFGVSEKDTLQEMLAESAKNQQEVTDQLGYQVRRAVEVLIQALDRADQDHGRALLKGVSTDRLYESALSVMMRLVFLFCAEERGLICPENPLYDQFYALSTLRARLREAADQHGEEVLERRLDAWCRLLSTFRAVHGGIEHTNMRIPPYGGRLFDPDRFPFLEGRKEGTTWMEPGTDETPYAPADPLPVNNRTVLHLLEALQILQIKVPGGGPAEARRLSFRALDIEQIGHVYEGLLDHTAHRAVEPILGLAGSKDKEPEIPLAELERLRDRGEDDLTTFLKDETGRSPAALKKALAATPEGQDLDRVQAVCGNDDDLFRRVRPFAGLLREDTRGYPVVIGMGSVFVTEGTDRRATGTHYTPRSLTESIVQHTLEPLVYDGPAEGKPREQWRLRPAAELLDLKVCDLACGSGAFLVQACRYLAERLVEAWDETSRRVQPGDQADLFTERSRPAREVIRISPYGEASKGSLFEELVPLDPGEQLVLAQRLVAQRCLYGVDKNKLAVEMAKLSLWLLTMARDRPFSFLDHAIRWGDSLLGVDLEQLRAFSLDRKKVVSLPNMLDMIPKILDANKLARSALTKIPDNTPDNVAEKARRLKNVEYQAQRLSYASDLLLAVSWKKASESEREALLRAALGEIEHRIRDEDPDALAAEGRRRRSEAGVPRPFHWPLEFPEVFLRKDRAGFDAFVCNPPFMGGPKITGNIGTEYRDYLVKHLADGKRGSADLCAYFFLRAVSLLNKSGVCGLVTTNTIAQGDTREVCLDRVVSADNRIVRAVSTQKWPGAASLYISCVWVSRSRWSGPYLLDGNAENGITSYLTAPQSIQGDPFKLIKNKSIAFKGSDVLGIGFVIDQEEAAKLISENPNNRKVVFPFINGEELYSSPDLTPSRWIVNFRDWPLDRSQAPSDYTGPVASDFPDILRIVEDRVKPFRQRINDDGNYVMRKPLPEKWWIYNCPRMELYAKISKLDKVLTKPETSNTHAIALVSSNLVFSHALHVFATSSLSIMCQLQSTFHELWARQYASSMKTDMRYVSADCFETYPFGTHSRLLEEIAHNYNETRSGLMQKNREGLTKTYHRFHDPDESVADIQTLRDLHVEMDRAVAAAYGWTDLDLGHGFHETRQGLRFTLSEPARREVLARLLALNHQRHAEEVKQGLHAKKGGTKTPSSRRRKPSSSGSPLFGADDE